MNGLMKCVCFKDCILYDEIHHKSLSFKKDNIYFYHNWLSPTCLVYYDYSHYSTISSECFYITLKHWNFDEYFTNLNGLRRKKLKKINDEKNS